MEATLEATTASSDAPIKVEVVNTDDFREDLAHKIIAAVAVATCVGVTKMALDYFSPEKREARKAAKAAKQPELKQVK